MSEALKHETPDRLYQRGLSGESDIYYVYSGPNDTRGWGAGVPLFHVEMAAGEPLDQDQVAVHLPFYEDTDPQPPHLMSHEELEAKLDAYKQAFQEQTTEEFERLTDGQ